MYDRDLARAVRALAIPVNPPSLHVGNLDGVAASNINRWSATVKITVNDWRHNLVNGASVRGTWNGSSSEVQCTTTAGGNGTCSVVLSSISNSTRAVSFAVTALTLSGYGYTSSANHDPDGNSNGFSITVSRP